MFSKWMTALGAVRAKYVLIARKFANATCRSVIAAISLVLLLLVPTRGYAGLYQSTEAPLHQFGFSTGGDAETAEQFNRIYDVAKGVLGDGAIVRTGLTWDPTKREAPNFGRWSETILENALAKNIILLPGIRTLNLDAGGLRMPTDAQWTQGLRQIVSMYGPGGIYQKGGSYVANGVTFPVDPHPGFKGLTDYELWNEPNTQGNLNGAMTPARITHLLKIGSEVMRDEASKLGFTINVVGPAIGGTDLEYLKELWRADRNVFSYVDTLSFHDYMRFPPSHCDPRGLSKRHCIKSFALIRRFMDANGGAHVHLAATEGGYAGDKGTCLGPQVQTLEHQREYSEQALRWLRLRPWLKFDFWMTWYPIDRPGSYSHPCESGKYDIDYWETKLGVVHPDLTLKPWGWRYRELVNRWRTP